MYPLKGQMTLDIDIEGIDYLSPVCDIVEFLSTDSMLTGSIEDWEYDEDVIS